MSLPVNQRLPENQPSVNTTVDQKTASYPSLDIYSKSTAWSRTQRRCYGRAMSWMREAEGRGCQLLWVMLSTSETGEAKKLGLHFQELRRRVERKFNYYVEFFKVETCEGFGVLHMVWAIKTERAVWIPQSWLSEEWEKIHGARVVWIARVKKTKKSIRNVAAYFVGQYLGGQSAIVRISWSWWRSRVAIGKAWSKFNSLFGRGDLCKPWGGLNWRLRGVSKLNIIKAWEEFLEKGCCVVEGAKFFIVGRSVAMTYL